MRILELFGGYGSQALALENLGIEFKSDLCDNDKYAEKAYNQIHGETFNYGDICTIDETKLPYYDLITYSSPCQDFSVAGKQAGGEKGSGTRSSLLWECERIIRAVKPKYLLMENVKALTGKKFKPLFAKWLMTLESIGYKNYWKVLNAKDYGVPQNRERVFVVSILGDQKYQFPNPIPLKKRIKDILETNVDEKYYLSEKICQRFQYKKMGEDVIGTTKGEECTRKGNRDFVYSVEHKIGALSATDYKQPKQIMEPKVIQEPINLYPNSGNPQAGRVYNSDGISPAMDTCQGGNRMPKITEYRFFEQAIQTAKEKEAKEGDTIDAFNKRVNSTGISPTLTTRPEGFKTAILPIQGYRIRKLTPRECWRLMGVRDYQYDKLHDISNAQLYKMAGNSIVVDVLMAIFKNMLIPEEKEQKGQLQLL